MLSNVDRGSSSNDRSLVRKCFRPLIWQVRDKQYAPAQRLLKRTKSSRKNEKTTAARGRRRARLSEGRVERTQTADEARTERRQGRLTETRAGERAGAEKTAEARCCARGTRTAATDGSQQQESDGETRRRGRQRNSEREQRAEAEKKW